MDRCPDIIWSRGGFQQAKNYLRRFKGPHKVYYGAGIRYNPKGKYDLILVDSGFPGEPDLFETLEALNFHTLDFTLLINTHVHIDHVGNNSAFPNARIVVSRVDYEYTREFSRALMETDDIVATLTRYFPHSSSRRIKAAAQHMHHMTRLYWREDILGSPAQIEWIEEKVALPDYISMLPTPGHTPGHHSFVFHGQELPFIIAGDAMPSRLFWKRQLQELSPRYDTQLFSSSKTKIEELRGIVMGGHDLPFRTDNLTYVETKRITV